MKIMHTTFGAALLAALLSQGAAARGNDGVVIRGVDPQTYLRARQPAPHAMRELKLLPAEVSVQILEQGPDAFLAPDSAYPEKLDAAQRTALRAQERLALIEGALAALAERADPRAPALVAKHLASADPAVRAAAAARSRDLQQLVAVASHDVDAGTRAAACVGLGKLRTREALLALAPFVRDDKDAERQLAAVRALSALGSRWVSRPVGAELRSDALALLDDAPLAGAVALAADDVRRALK